MCVGTTYPCESIWIYGVYIYRTSRYTSFVVPADMMDTEFAVRMNLNYGCELRELLRGGPDNIVVISGNPECQSTRFHLVLSAFASSLLRFSRFQGLTSDLDYLTCCELIISLSYCMSSGCISSSWEYTSYQITGDRKIATTRTQHLLRLSMSPMYNPSLVPALHRFNIFRKVICRPNGHHECELHLRLDSTGTTTI